jgi:Ser/Thr protein kinase RdoA (MazF antagonist)
MHIEIQEYVFGKSPKKISAKLAYALGVIHGQIDYCLLRIKFSRIELNSMNNTHKTIPNQSKLPVSLRKAYFDIQQKFDSTKGIRSSVINGDFSAWNTIIKGKKIVSILDWADLHKDYLILEPAIFITDNLVDNSKSSLNKMKHYLKGYQETIQFTKLEKESFKLILEYAQLRKMFWLYAVREKNKSRLEELNFRLEVANGKYQLIKRLDKKSIESLIQF